DSSPYLLTVVGGTLFFVATDDASGSELWKSDGTEAGTGMGKDISPIGGPAPRGLTAGGGRPFFVARDGGPCEQGGARGRPAEGTVLAKDIRPGSPSSFASNFAAAGRRLHFRAVDDVKGAELWRSDGTTGGTVLFHDIQPGSGSSIPTGLHTVGSLLYFSADD